MKRVVLLFTLTIIGIINSIAGNWKLKYLIDQFGDLDYSKPAYEIHCESTQYRGSHINIAYINDTFALNPVFDLLDVKDAESLKAKASDGSIYEFNIDKTHRRSGVYWITEDSDVKHLVNLLEQGNFTLNFHRSADFYDEAYNYNFKIGKQGQGIRSIRKSAAYPETRIIPQTPPDTYKGSIGKYKITMQLNTPFVDDSGNYIVNGVYWYGSGKNGKMTLKGELIYDSNMHRTYRFDEYDPNGRKCGTFLLSEGYNASTRVSFLDGCMTNKAGTSYKVYLKKEEKSQWN